MRKLTSVFAVITFCAAMAYGQKEMPDFSGTWSLDVTRSEMGRRPVKSMTMNVIQDASLLSYQRKTEFDEGARFGAGRRGMGRGRIGDGGQPLAFDLSGKETSSASAAGMGGDVKLSANLDGEHLRLSVTRSFNGMMGEMTIKTVELWSLSENSKTLTVSSESETPRGTRSSKMVFTRSD